MRPHPPSSGCPAMKPIHIFPILLLLPLTACGGGDADGGAATVRDSAGIQIVENRDGRGGRTADGGSRTSPRCRSAWRTGTRSTSWTACARRCGWATDASWWPTREATSFAGTTRKGGTPPPPGARAAGPASSKAVALRRLPGDSVLAYDLSAFRLSWFDPPGRFVRSPPLQPVGQMPPRFVDRFADGSLLLSSSVRTLGSRPSRARGATRCSGCAPARTACRWIRSRHAGQRGVVPVPHGSGQIQSMNILTLPFMRNVHTGRRRPLLAGDHRRVRDRAAAGGRHAGAHRAAHDGAGAGARRVPRQPAPRAGGGAGAGGGKSLDEVQVPEQLPAFERLLVDDGGGTCGCSRRPGPAPCRRSGTSSMRRGRCWAP